MTIKVQVPPNTPAGDAIWMRVDPFKTDERSVKMSPVAGSSGLWQASITAPAGTIFRYFYFRNEDWGKTEQYAAFQSFFPSLREVVIANGATVTESIAQWMDTPAVSNSTGIITGVASDETGNPLTGIWVSAGPHQVMTFSDGTYAIEGVPAGLCPVTFLAENGEYRATMVTATVVAGRTVTQNVTMRSAAMSMVRFNVRVPSATPSGAVPRLTGDTYQLGIEQLYVPPDITRVPDMTPAGSNQWTYSIQLGNGTCVNYAYTLGYWARNNERDSGGSAVSRSLCVNGPTTVNDTVAAWKSPAQVPVSLNVVSPTGAEDALYLSTADDFGGSAALKMWRTGAGKASYTLYVNASSVLQYRYVRNGDHFSPEIIGGQDAVSNTYRSLSVGVSGASSNDTIAAWRHQMREPALSTVTTGLTVPISPRAPDSAFQTGVEVIDYWQRAWLPLIVPTMARIKSKNAEWVQIPSISSYVDVENPTLERNGFPRQDLVQHIRAAKSAGLKIVLKSFPFPNNFYGSYSNAWYDQFFSQLQKEAVYHAALAQQEGVEMLMLANFNFGADGGPNDSPAARTYINSKWKGVIAAIRASGYTGRLTIDYFVDRPEYGWYSDLDYLGDKWWWPVATTQSDTVQSMYNAALAKLASYYLPIENRFHKPFIFSELAYYSAATSAMQQYQVDAAQINDFLPADPSVDSSYDQQARAYQAVLLALANTPWVQGCYSFGYSYFNFDSKGYSIRAKTAEEVMSQIYKQINPPSILYSVPLDGGMSSTSQGGSSTTTVGYARIQPWSGNTTPSGLAIFGFRQNNVLVTEAGVPASPLVQSGRIYAEVNGPVNTGLAMANPNNQAATVTFFFTDANGDFGSGSTTIPSNGQIASFLDQAPFNGRSSLSGSLTFNSSLPISVIAIRGYNNERSEFLITTLPVADLAAAPASGAIVFPHFADGGGWTTQIVLVNPTDNVLTGSIQFRDQAGQASNLSVNGQNSSSYSIPARSFQKLQTSGTGSSILSGSVRAIPAANGTAPSGVAIFSFRNDGKTVAEAGVPASPAANAFRIYSEASGDFNRGAAGSIQTGVAMANNSGITATVTLELNKLDGSSTGLTGTLQIPANGQVAAFLNQIQGFASLQMPFQGVLRVSSPASIAMVGLRGRYNERNDFLFTTTPPVNEAAAPSSSTLSFPHIVDGGGYTTQFILFSGQTSQTSSGTLQLFSQSGETLVLSLR